MSGGGNILELDDPFADLIPQKGKATPRGSGNIGLRVGATDESDPFADLVPATKPRAVTAPPRTLTDSLVSLTGGRKPAGGVSRDAADVGGGEYNPKTDELWTAPNASRQVVTHEFGHRYDSGPGAPPAGRLRSIIPPAASGSQPARGHQFEAGAQPSEYAADAFQKAVSFLQDPVSRGPGAVNALGAIEAQQPGTGEVVRHLLQQPIYAAHPLNATPEPKRKLGAARPLAPMPAQPDVTRVGAEPVGLEERLRNEHPTLLDATVQGVKGMVEHPIDTGVALAEAPFKGGQAVGEYVKGGHLNEGKGRAAAIGALQTAAMLSGPVERLAEPIVARVLGEAAAPFITRTAAGAAAGATFSPDRPAVGAIIGGAAGALSSHGAAAEKIAADRARFEDLAKQHPDWLGENAPPEALKQLSDGKPVRTATAKVDEFSMEGDVPPAHGQPDYAVGEPNAAPEPVAQPPVTSPIIEKKGVFGGGLEQHGQDFAAGKVPPPETSITPPAPVEAAPATATAPEPAAKQHDYSSTQVNLPDKAAVGIKRLAASIPEADLAENGRENTPHITVKYGLHGTPVEEVRKLLENEPPVTVTLGKTSFFPNSESNSGDVLKADVESPDLRRLNAKIAAALPNTDTHPGYKPHATIAYLKPGLGKKYAGDNALAGEEITLDHVTFSGKDGKTVDIPLKGAVTPIHPKGDIAPAAAAPTEARPAAELDHELEQVRAAATRAKPAKKLARRKVTAADDEERYASQANTYEGQARARRWADQRKEPDVVPPPREVWTPEQRALHHAEEMRRYNNSERFLKPTHPDDMEALLKRGATEPFPYQIREALAAAAKKKLGKPKEPKGPVHELARTTAGRLRDNLETVKSDGLVTEMFRLLGAEDPRDQQAAIYRNVEADVSGTQYGQHIQVATRHGNGPSEQAKALHRIELKKGAAKRIEAILNARGLDNNAITSRYADIVETALDRAAEQQGLDADKGDTSFDVGEPVAEGYTTGRGAAAREGTNASAERAPNKAPAVSAEGAGRGAGEGALEPAASASEIRGKRLGLKGGISAREMAARAKAGETREAVTAITGQEPTPLSTDKKQSEMFTSEEAGAEPPDQSDLFAARKPPASGKIYADRGRGGGGRSGSASGRHKANPAAAQGVAPRLKLPEPSGLSQPRSNIRPAEFVRALKSFFNPESLGPEALAAAGTIRHQHAEAYHRLAITTHALDDFKGRVDKLSREEQVQLWDDAERGESIGDATLDEGNRLLRRATDERTQQLIALDRLKAEKVIENYVGRFWSQTTSGSGRDFLRAIMGRRPFEGPKSFLKQRELDWFVDGLKRGDLVPATYNYVESQLAKIAEMERVIAAEHTLRQEKALGRAKPLMLGQEPPVDQRGDKWVKIDRTGEDPAFNIYLPPDVQHWEAVDTLVYGKLQRLIDALNVQHTRSPKIGGSRLGYAEGDKHIATKFGGAEGVVMHELGHILDARYGLADRINEAIGKAPTRTVGKGKKLGQQVPDYKGEGKDAAQRRKALREELRQLANLRAETLSGVPGTKDLGKTERSYLHSTPEKMANMVEAYISARDRFRQVAPGIFDIFDKIVGDNPELLPLRDIQPSLSRESHGATTRVSGIITGGHWYAPKDAAAVWGNHLSKGLAGNPIYDAAIAPIHAGTQMLLGFSGFHGTVIATEAAFSDLALAIDNLVNTGGVAVRAPKQIGRGAVSPVAGVSFGRKVMQEYRIPGTHPELKQVLDAMIAGGFRGKATSELWSGDRKDRLKRAFREALYSESKGRRLWGASKLPFDAIWAGVEFASGPLMSKYVPLMKTAATYNAAAQALEKLPPNTPIDVLHRVMGDVVKEMDYRFGQVDYDNHFINRVAKDLAQLVFLAPGWTFGTLALAGRGLGDVAKIPVRAARLARGTRRNFEMKDGNIVEQPNDGGDEPPPELIGRSAAYWIGAVLGTMLINGTLTYWSTKERPHGMDYWAFRDGTKDQAGNWNRHTVPGYLMHDIYGWSKHPVHTFKNKFAPTLAFFLRLAENKDYFGDMVYDPEASLPTKVKQAGKALVKEHTPLSLQNYLEGKKRGEVGPTEVARNVFGVTPARRELVRTPAQNLMAEYSGRNAPSSRTPEEADKGEVHRLVIDAVRKGEMLPQSVLDMMTPTEGERPKLSRETLFRWIGEAKQPNTVTQFKRLTLDEAQKVWKVAYDDEKAMWANAYRTKVVNAR